MKNTALFLLIMSVINSANAGIDNLVKYASPESSMHNVNAPKIVQEQEGGYITGGSIILRGPRPQELAPINIQTPKLKYDACTGSGDFRFGAFSYISAREFSQFLKNVARASGAYLVKMSIKTSCPQCEDIMTYLETVARDINGLTMNQCALAQNLSAGIASKVATSDKQRCMMISNIYNQSDDMFDATAKCQDNIGKPKEEPEELGSLLGDEYNLVWKALSKGGGSDINFKELMMSVSGTIIRQKTDNAYKFIYKPSLLHDEDLLEKYIGNSTSISEVKLYKCDEATKCLNVTSQKQTLSREETIYGNISKIFDGIIKKVIEDKGQLTDEEEALIGFSSIPILKLIETELSNKASSQNIMVRVPEFVEVICYDVISNFMQIILSKVLVKVSNLEHAQIDNSIIRNFIDDAENVRRILSNSKFTAFKKLQIILQVKERLDNQTKSFEHSFGKFMGNLEQSP